MYSFDSSIEADSSLTLLPSPFALRSNDQFRELSYDDFPWAFAISGLTIALLVGLELALERVIDDRMNHSKPEEKTLTEVEASGQEDQRTNECNGEDEDHKVQDLELQLDNAVGKEEHHDHAHVVDKENPLASILLAIALSIHSIIEGIGVGATGDVGTITSEFIAILVHKCFTAFALGNQLISSGYWTSKRKYFYISIGLFIGVSLLGIGIGWAIASADSSITEAVFVGITAGSFIFVAALEIIPEEARIVKQERLNIPLVVFSFIAGYILMAMLAIWV